MRRLILGLLAATLLGTAAYAIQPDEVLPDPAMEARARTIGKDLRCLVCQNQSIDDSDADLARDLRLLVRQRLVAGDNDEAAKKYVVDRYGDYVLLNPPFKASTLLLWIGPVILLAIALAALFGYFRKRPRAVQAAPLSADEMRRLAELTGTGSDKEGGR